MLTLANNTKVIFIASEERYERWGYHYYGWNTVGNLVSVLAHRFYETNTEGCPKTLEALQKLRETGMLCPGEKGDTEEQADNESCTYWVVEKAIPTAYRPDVWADRMDIKAVIDVLKV